MKIINILRGPESISVVLEYAVPHPLVGGTILRIFDPVASFPVSRPECAAAVAEAMGKAMMAPVIWL